MSIIEQIKAEVERRIETYKKGYANGDDRRADALELLLSFLPTLQEQPVCEDLEDAIESFKEKIGFPVYWCDEKEQMDWLSITARHFYSLGRQIKPEVSEELEEAARLYASPMGRKDVEHLYEYPYSPADVTAFIAGAKWQKEQMLKEAVEGDIGMILHDKTSDLYVRSKDYLPKSLGIKCGDKVRIVIVKEG